MNTHMTTLNTTERYISTVLALFLIFVMTLFSMNTQAQSPKGQLYLVSVGIGDPDNITVKAQKTIARADIIFGMKRVQERFPDLIADKEVYEAGHALFTPMAHRGKTESEVEATEQQARDIIRNAIKDGKTVAIIDYGDPTIYGPQIGYLHEFRDLEPVVIPGISSFNAANAALATGVTNGKNSHSVIITAAMGLRDGYEGKDSLAQLAKSQSSLVFFTMGLDLAEAVEQLQQHYPANTPIAIVSHAGEDTKQSILKATLDTIIEKTEGGKLPFEHLIYVGDFLE